MINLQTKDNLNEEEKGILDKLLNEYYEKIKRELGKDVVINFNLKIYEGGGKNYGNKKEGKEEKHRRKKYSINLKVINSVVFKSDAFDYDLAKAAHIGFNKIMSEIEHKFHVSNQNRRF